MIMIEARLVNSKMAVFIRRAFAGGGRRRAAGSEQNNSKRKFQ